MKNCPKVTVAAAVFSVEWDNPYQGNPLSSSLSSFVKSSLMGPRQVSYSLFCTLFLVVIPLVWMSLFL